MTNNKDIGTLRNLSTDVEGTYVLLYKEHFSMIRHFVVNNSGSDTDAQDLFQESVISLYEMSLKPDFKLSAKLSTLLYSIARNKWLKLLRDNKPKVNINDYESHIAIDEEHHPSLQEGALSRMAGALKQLGQPCYDILVWFYYHKKSMQEIAQEKGYSGQAHAKAQKYKCLQRLKKMASTWK